MCRLGNGHPHLHDLLPEDGVIFPSDKEVVPGVPGVMGSPGVFACTPGVPGVPGVEVVLVVAPTARVAGAGFPGGGGSVCAGVPGVGVAVVVGAESAEGSAHAAGPESNSPNT